MWFSYLEYRDLCYGMNAEDFTAFTKTAVANMQELGVNTLYLHAVAFTDAFYESEIYPRSAILGDIDYDPFAIFLSAKARPGMQVQAWINPMRSIAATRNRNLPEDFTDPEVDRIQ